MNPNKASLSILHPQFRKLTLPWALTTDEARTLWRFTLSSILLCLLLMYYSYVIEIPEQEPQPVPEELLQTVLREREERKEQAEERKQDAIELAQKVAAEEEAAVEEEKPPEKKPTVDEKDAARERASKEGLAALQSEFEDLQSFSDSADLGLTEDIQTVTTGVASGNDDGSLGGGLLALESNTAGSGGTLVTNRGAIRGGSAGGLRKGTAGVSSGIRGRAGVRPGGSGAAKAKKKATSVGGGRTAEEIQIVFDTNKGLLDRLYQKALRANPSLRGEVLFELVIAPAGNVVSVRVISSALNDPKLEQKMVRRITVFQFGPKSSSSGNATIRFPINFLPSA